MRFFHNKGFTLIEILIVVAIIAILAAIAIPNLLEAQVRSKVARQKANMRTIATALEAYMVDHNKYPPVTDNPANGSWTNEEMRKIFPGVMTTPVAYISSDAPLVDIFRRAHDFPNPLAYQVMYLPSSFYAGNPVGYAEQCNRYGLWLIASAGPDTYYQNHPDDKADYGVGIHGRNPASYDPSNGTNSGGDIYRSQKDAAEEHE
jgi:prepilin-type N-terminal cleavage/methylation domain-containing protein